jgi:hypothetical protein
MIYLFPAVLMEETLSVVNNHEDISVTQSVDLNLSSESQANC